MTRRIPDLLSDYHETHLSLPETAFPTAQRTKELTMKKLGLGRRHGRRVSRGVLIAAVMALIMSITAGAAYLTLWDRARNDLGVQDRDVPEYTEYHVSSDETQVPVFSDEVMAQYAVEDANIDLISTFCSGNIVVTYLAISPVTPDMAEATREESQNELYYASWWYSFSDVVGTHKDCRSAAMDATQVEYDAETQTALIRLYMEGEVFGEATEMTLSLTWIEQTEEHAIFKHYGDVGIPITQSEALHTEMDIPVENTYLPSIPGKLTSVEVRAGDITATMEIPSFYEACELLGENAHYTIGDAYWNYHNAQTGQPMDTEFSELDAYVAYKRSWSSSFDSFSKDLTLVLRDGTTILVTQQDSIYAGWADPITDSDDTEYADYMAQTTIQHNFVFSVPLELIEVEAVVVDGVEYLLEAQ